ncbi:TIR domain-containing protein (plasmid) [Arsenophonus sp. aPb]|uniref:TIR domain-containing protein n=1 Tax=Arsenophonus sp. aPb TaxID=3041619 RepID=UPI002468769E|nr:TIR domain-containing protein [Arsenophonus sp. aPb]WGL99935.1 TIR domain-containing protein [Arsenophonus sp. aPb]
MKTYQIHVFISHSWKYSNHYEKLADWIFNKSWRSGETLLDFRDFSVPKNDSIHNASTDKALQDAIFNQIVRSHVIVIPAGLYTNYSKWIQKEIDGAKGYKKPILAVNPWGQQYSSDIVISNANKCVGWNSESVVSGIWELYRI